MVFQPGSNSQLNFIIHFLFYKNESSSRSGHDFVEETCNDTPPLSERIKIKRKITFFLFQLRDNKTSVT